MKISQLEYFVEAAERLNFTHAASSLFTTRQSISHAVKALEAELGVKLFSQSAHGLVLTTEGQTAYAHAKKVLHEVRELSKAFLMPEVPEHALYILIGTNILAYSQYDLPQALSSIGIFEFTLGELNCSDCYKHIVTKKADLSFIACMPRTFPECEAVMLDESYLYLLVNAESDLAKKDGLFVDDILGHKLMVPPGFEFQMHPLVKGLEEKHAPTNTMIPLSSFEYVTEKIIEGGCIGIASQAQKACVPDGLAIKPLIEPGMSMGLYALYRSDSPQKKLFQSIASRVSTDVGPTH